MDTNEMEQQGIWDEAFEKGEQSGKLATLKEVLTKIKDTKTALDKKYYNASAQTLKDVVQWLEAKIKEGEK